MLADAAAGLFDVVLAYTSSRLTRRPREHEDLIELAESHGIRFEYVRSPSFDLNTSAGRRVARILAANDAAESEYISERVAAACLQRAKQGRSSGGGYRRFGYERDGCTVRSAEAAEVVSACEAVLAGVSLAQIAADLRDRQVKTVTGKPWTAQGIRSILLRPRIAGLASYRGEVLEGVTPEWPAIVDRDVWDAVRVILTDPARRTTPGNTPRWLGSGLYRCGHPDCVDANPPRTLRVGSGQTMRTKAKRYVCTAHYHLSRQVPGLDGYVTEVITTRLARPDAVDLLAAPADAGVDTVALRRDADALRVRIAEAGDLWEDGTLSVGEYRTHKTRLQQRLDDIEAQLRTAAGRDPLADIAGQPNAADIWQRLDLGRQRANLDTLLVITVLPTRRGRPPAEGEIDPERVDVQPRRAG